MEPIYISDNHIPLEFIFELWDITYKCGMDYTDGKVRELKKEMEKLKLDVEHLKKQNLIMRNHLNCKTWDDGKCPNCINFLDDDCLRCNHFQNYTLSVLSKDELMKSQI